MIKFLHLADVHLDTIFQNRSSELRAKLRNGIREAFEAAVDLALSSGCHAFLISGDLFDNQTLSFATEKFLYTEMQRLGQGQVQVFYATGNHDPSGSSYRVQQIRWPENVHIFTETTPKAYPLFNREGQVIAMVVGAGHITSQEGTNLASLFPCVEGEELPHLALLHALVTGSTGDSEHERYAPCTLRDLKGKGYTYWALGHIHKREVLAENPYIVYPGNLMGRNAKESGAKGAYLVEIDDYGQVKTDFYSLAPLSWHELTVNNLRDVDNYEELLQSLTTTVESQLEKNREEQLFIRLKLSGPCPLFRDLAVPENVGTLTENLRELLAVEYLELETEGLLSLLNPEQYKEGPHVLSELLVLLDSLEGNEAKLLQFAPKDLAGCHQKAEPQEKIKYLRTLLEDLDYEAVARLAEVEEQ